MPVGVVYNHVVLRRLAILGTCAAGMILVLPACGKKSSAGNQEANSDLGKSFEPPQQREPVAGIDLAKLDERERARFEDLIDRLASPCAKPHSLRASKNSDPSCVRAGFALQLVRELIDDGESDKSISEIYRAQYSERPQHAFKLASSIPHTGPEDATVVMVEFFDYGCPACQMFAPELDAAVRKHATDAVLYYKQFPLAAHEHSFTAAQASIAAFRQGKFDEMHRLLFANAPRHTVDDLNRYAQSLELDIVQFKADFAAAAELVTAEKNEGIAVGVHSTPSLYVNGRLYEGPLPEKYVSLFILEQIAANR